MKVLLDDAISALKNNDINNALVHLDLVKQQLGSGSVVNTPSNATKNTAVSELQKLKQTTLQPLLTEPLL